MKTHVTLVSAFTLQIFFSSKGAPPDVKSALDQSTILCLVSHPLYSKTRAFMKLKGLLQSLVG